MLLTPVIGSIDDLLKETQEELGQKPPDKIKLDLQLISEVWNSYKESVTSPSTKVTLENVKMEIDGEAIHIIVPSSVSKEEITQEVLLYEKLRKRFNNGDLAISITVDRSRFPELEDLQSKKIYTMKEKYDHLVEKNPDLDYLVKKLNLKIDQE